ncbi:hypothetical protein MAR_019194 [Mya arenaria]|uniref:Uncharacterized protein n=1 Tax=Mya arenaria TaxID=6604 RepID=A0ABY7EPY6_MYAAR|nr:hypothetical protein MAR_019194 [Mya arenaria]
MSLHTYLKEEGFAGVTIVALLSLTGKRLKVKSQAGVTLNPETACQELGLFDKMGGEDTSRLVVRIKWIEHIMYQGVAEEKSMFALPKSPDSSDKKAGVVQQRYHTMCKCLVPYIACHLIHQIKQSFRCM